MNIKEFIEAFNTPLGDLTMILKREIDPNDDIPYDFPRTIMTTPTKTTTATLPTMKLTDFLPKKPTVNNTKPETLVQLIYGAPGVGKTSFACANPDCILAACESGHKFISANKVVIDCWKHQGAQEQPWIDEDGNTHMSFLQFVKAMEESIGTYKTVIIDTIDMLVKMCIDYHCEKAKVAHIGDMGDYGKGYEIGQNIPIRKAFNDLLTTGRGVIFTSHEQITSIKTSQGEKHKKETTLPTGIHKFLYGQCDLILHLMKGGIRPPNQERDVIACSDPTEEAMAKNRGGVLPLNWIIDPIPAKAWKQFDSFFKDRKNVDIATKEYNALYQESK